MNKELEEWYKLHEFYKYFDYLTKDLADYLKVNPRTVQRWIKGKTSPSKKRLSQIKRYLAEKASETKP
ncbi:helix-turn-helix domain-containing protein [Candidatus Omnitrophota bacterium]